MVPYRVILNSVGRAEGKKKKSQDTPEEAEPGKLRDYLALL